MQEKSNLEEISSYNPIRKLVRYRGTVNPMYYEVGKTYGGGKLVISNIELDIVDHVATYYVFVNKLLSDGNLDTVEYLWKTEKAADISVEYDLSFDDEVL